MHLLTCLRVFLFPIQASILVLAFYSTSISQPLLTQMSLRRYDSREVEMMGRALGIPDSGLLLQRRNVTEIDTNEPLDKLLANKKFRQSFMAFADRSIFSFQLASYLFYLISSSLGPGFWYPLLDNDDVVIFKFQLFGWRECAFL